MLHPVVEACLFQRKLVYASWMRGVRVHTPIYAGAVAYMEFLKGQTLVAENLIWVCQSSSGTGSGGVDNLIMHCWHYLRSSWFKYSSCFGSGESEAEGA